MTEAAIKGNPAPSPAKRYAPAYERVLSKRTTEDRLLGVGIKLQPLALNSFNIAPTPKDWTKEGSQGNGLGDVEAVLHRISKGE